MAVLKGYSFTQIRLHWIIAVLIVGQLIFGEEMGEEDQGEEDKKNPRRIGYGQDKRHSIDSVRPQFGPGKEKFALGGLN